MSLTSIISASTWQNIKSKDSFEILTDEKVEAEILPKYKLGTFLWTQCTTIKLGKTWKKLGKTNMTN